MSDKYDDILELPCPDCITYAICQNKDPHEMILCPLLDPALRKCLIGLKAPYDSNDNYTTKVTRLDPFKIITYMTRISLFKGNVDIIEDGVLTFTSRGVVL